MYGYATASYKSNFGPLEILTGPYSSKTAALKVKKDFRQS